MVDDAQAQRQKEMMKTLTQTQLLYFGIFIFSMVVIYLAPLREAIGSALGTVLNPSIGFNFKYPVVTLVLSGVIIGVVTAVPRYIFTDWLKMGKAQSRTRAFSEALRKAYRENDQDKVKKLQKLRTEMTMEQQVVQMNNTKPLMFLSFFTILIFVWLFVFVYVMKFPYISTPWNPTVPLLGSFLGPMPYWVFLYFVSNLVIGYFITMLIKFVDFTYKAREIENRELQGF
ncbi:MAG: DUF106 domain-containing protein [Thermoplasmataceae archaeon]